MERPGDDRLAALMRTAARRRLDAVLLFGEANVRALTGVACDNCCLALVRAPTASSFSTVFITDFRYVPMVHRVAPGLKTVELARGVSFAAAAKDVCAKARAGQPVRRIGYEGTLATWRYLELRKEFPRATPVDVDGDVKSLRAVKTVEEITRIAAAEALNDEIWARAQKDIRPNMTEKDIQRVIRAHGVWLRPFCNFIYAMPPLVSDAGTVDRIVGALLDLAAAPPGPPPAEGDFHE